MMQAQRLSFRLLEKITNYFSEDRILGRGAYGIVYMGEHKDGQKIAVKVFHDHPGFDDTIFNEECRKCIEHKNIVQLVGYCHETTREYVQHEGRVVYADMTKRALCFEYARNGSLYHYLRGTIYDLGLKPANILLDDNMLPKISDFGLLRLAGNEQEEIMDRHIGTLRYMASEYIEAGVVSAKFNISRRRLIVKWVHEGFCTSAGKSSHEFIENVYGDWMNRLQETTENELESYWNQVRTCAEKAISCVEAERHKRSTIGIIVTKLNETRRTAASASASAPYLNNHTPSGSTASSRVTIGSPAHPRGALMSKDPTVMVSRADQFSPMLRDSAQPPPPAQQMRSKPPYMSLQHLKEITKDFSEEKVLGRGGSCEVYKGEHDGELIAVKKIKQSWSSEENSKKTEKQFQNELNLLMEIKHPNIVELLGHCYETHSARISDNGRDILLWQIDCLLCLEFLPESLNNHISDATSGLDWHTRYKIIEGISNGLQYLHEQSPDPIIHMDLKPGNILLDANMVPKVADFGISRLFEQGQTIHTKITPGTLGYIPPEYIRDGIITPKNDIFSLGVIIIEVITGHRNYPHDLKASSKKFVNTELLKWRSMLRKKPGNTNMETDCQQIEKCIQIGLMCLNPDRTKRPTMRNISNILQGIESTTTE